MKKWLLIGLLSIIPMLKNAHALYFYINNNSVSSDGIKKFIEEISKNTTLESLGTDMIVSNIDDAYLISQTLLTSQNLRNITCYKLNESSADSIKVFVDAFANQNNIQLSIQDTYFDNAEQIKALGSSNVRMAINKVELNNGQDFINEKKLNINNWLTFTDDAMANAMIENTNTYENLNIRLSRNINLTSAPIITILENALNFDQSTLTIDLSANFGKVDTNIAPALGTLLAEKQPSKYSFNFSDISGNSNDLIQAITKNLANIGAPSSNYIKYNNGTINNLTSDQWSFIFKNFSTILFSANQLGSNMSELISGITEKPDHPFFWLDLSFNQIDDDGANLLFPALTNALNKSHPTAGFFLSFGGNPLGDNGVDAMVAFFNQFGTYAHHCLWNQVALDGSNFTEDNWVKIFTSLKTANLSSLSLNKCPLTSKALQSLGELLVACPNIWFLNLNRCEINDESIGEFAKAIVNIDSIPQYIDMKHNKIKNLGAIALATALKTVKNEIYGSLYVQNNLIGTKGAKALIEINMEKNITSSYLNNNPITNRNEMINSYQFIKGGNIGLSKTSISNKNALVLAHIIAKNNVFDTIALNDNQINDSGILAIAAALNGKKLNKQSSPEKIAIEKMISNKFELDDDFSFTPEEIEHLINYRKNMINQNNKQKSMYEAYCCIQ